MKRGKHRKYIVDTGFHFGEWLEPGAVMMKDILKAALRSDEEVATAYFGHSAKILSEIASILGKNEDAKTYDNLYQNICWAYQEEFLSNGKVVSERQCRYVRPIALDMVTNAHKKQIAADLIEKVIANGYRIGTGFLSTPKILSVLTEYGYVGTAYKILENKQQPGWLYSITKRATTIWENWLGKDENNVPRDSMNHYAPGSVVACLFDTVAGIRSLTPGFEKIKISPVPGGTLSYAKASYDSCQGKIVSSWKFQDGEFILDVIVPFQAEVYLPNREKYEVGSGEWQFKCKF